MKTITKKKTAKTALTKSVFRQFNRKTAAGRRETVAMLAETLTGAGKAFLDPSDRVVISNTVLGKVLVLIIPAGRIRGWCGNEPRPLPFPPPPPRPGPCPCPAYLTKEERKRVGLYMTALLKEHTSPLRLETLGAGFRTIDIGGKANLHVMGKL